MKCEICGLGPPQDDVALFRQNAKGQRGVWRCREHNEAPIESEVDEIVRIIEADNAKGSQ